MERVFLLCLAVRVLHAVLSATAFAPDEYWQSVEVAHRAVFGYGHLTWEWAAGLRSYVHPAIFAALYWVLHEAGLDGPWLVAKGPMLLQAVLAAATDLHVYRLARLLFGTSASRWALACQLSSWFNMYCLVRTYSSSVEACCMAVGTYHWLASFGAGSSSRKAGSMTAHRAHQQAWIVAAAACAAVRPPSILFWAPLALLNLYLQRHAGRGQLVADCVALGGGTLAVSALVDRIGYGRWVWVPSRFLRFNLLEGGSALYGAHPWHWNLSQGFPAISATLLPLVLVGLTVGKRVPLKYMLAWSIAVYSLPAHKEFRFLLPALQLAMPYCGLGAAWLAGRPAKSASAGRAAAPPGGSHLLARRLVLAACLLVQLPMGAYFSTVHHRGVVDVIGEVRALAAAEPAASVLFLTPCHATPYYSHVHLQVDMRFLDCSPPGWEVPVAALNEAGMAWLRLPGGCGAGAGADVGAGSQRQCFEADPAAYWDSVVDLNPGGLPSLLVGFGPVMEKLHPGLRREGYQLHRRLANCWVQTDDDTPCVLEIWRREHGGI